MAAWGGAVGVSALRIWGVHLECNLEANSQIHRYTDTQTQPSNPRSRLQPPHLALLQDLLVLAARLPAPADASTGARHDLDKVVLRLTLRHGLDDLVVGGGLLCGGCVWGSWVCGCGGVGVCVGAHSSNDQVQQHTAQSLLAPSSHTFLALPRPFATAMCSVTPAPGVVSSDLNAEPSDTGMVRVASLVPSRPRTSSNTMRPCWLGLNGQAAGDGGIAMR